MDRVCLGGDLLVACSRLRGRCLEPKPSGQALTTQKLLVNCRALERLLLKKVRRRKSKHEVRLAALDKLQEDVRVFGGGCY